MTKSQDTIPETDTAPPRAVEKRRLLVIDDDELVAASLRVALPANWTMIEASKVSEIPESGFVAAFVDMHLTGDLKKAEGLDVVRSLHRAEPQLEIVAMSGDFDRHLMEQGLKAGASRFLAKPIGTEELRLTLEKIEALLTLKEFASAQVETSSHEREPRWVGDSATSLEVTRKIASLRGESGPILIEGESGTGKEVAAWLLHSQEKRSNLRPGSPPRPFVQVNLGAIPESVFESELFGHVKGAFTGADQNKMGLCEAAHGGDLFLDEIEALPLTSQAKLLRFLENGEVRRVGARETIRVQTRVIVATNRSLSDMVSAGEFREDLMWRVSGKRLTLPPLRKRKDDIGALAKYFFDLERPRRNKQLTEEAIETLQQHDWSGNVRELKRVCEQIALYAPLPLVRREDVVTGLPQIARAGALVSSDGSISAGNEIDLSIGLNELLARFEARVVREALRVTSDVDQAAERIGISRSSMYKKMKDFGLDRK